MQGLQPFVVHDEIGAPPTAAFTEAWMPIADRGFARHLGMSDQEPVHVILADAATHAARFPPTVAELVRVLDRGEAIEARRDPDAISAQYSRSAYALGVATRIAKVQQPPSGAVEGALGIYVDNENVAVLAQEFNVDASSLLAVILAHELAHCRRGHANGVRASPTHDWVEEGDAQRDAWQVLTDLLADDAWAAVAYEARAAQLRLAEVQPSAYKHFAVTAAERAALRAIVAVPERQTWIVRPPRAVFRLVGEGSAEVPVFDPANSATPRVADRIYLCDDEMLAGPWTLVAIDKRPRVGRLTDVLAAKHLWKAVMWWQLLSGSHVMGATADVVEHELEELVPVKVGYRSFSWRLTGDAMQMARSIAERVTEERRGELLAKYGEDKLSNPRIKWQFESVNGWED